VPVRLGFDPNQIPADLDRVIIGNALPRSNVEVEAVLARGLPYISQAAAFGDRFCRDARTIVIAGTHGKTTTTSLTAHILTTAGLDPTVLVGGVPCGGRPWRLGAGGWTVVEGDEYNTAFFDKGPKFMHYHPHLFVVGNIEFDHGDLYPDLQAIVAAFRAGSALVGDTGWVVANAGDPGASAAVAAHRRVVRYGLDERNDLHCSSWRHVAGRLEATLSWNGERFDAAVPLVGRHNLDNLLAACSSALLAGLAPSTVAAAAATFPGVRRRLEVLCERNGVTVIDDFAHHPTAVRLTLEGARHRFPGRRLVAIFEPRSLTAGRSAFFESYIEAFCRADLALIAPIFHRARLAADQILDRDQLVDELAKRGVTAIALPEQESLTPLVAQQLHCGDVAIFMSSGDFGGLPRALVDALGGTP
jgi:UDP-N-acetylmuramate: L-alanyl-gamma-D-glutamyl-meso-diaminopimelate ligase